MKNFIKDFSRLGQAEGSDFSVNPLSLAFCDDSTEARFQKAYFRNNLLLGRVCHLLAVFFYVTVGFWDARVVDPDRMPVWIWVVGVVAAVFGLGLAASYLLPALYEKYWRPLFALYVLVTGFGFTLYTAVSAPAYPVYNFVGIILCLLFCYTLIRLTFVWASISGTAIVALYILTTLSAAGDPPREVFSSFFYMVAVNCLGMLVCYSQERISRKEFVLNELLRRRQGKISDLNVCLEERVKARTEELSQSLAALEQAEAMACLGYFEQNWQTGKIFWSKGFARILGARAIPHQGSLEAFLCLVDPADKKRFAKEVTRALKNKDKLDIRFKITTEENNTIEVHTVADSVFDAGGRPLVTRGILRDVTARQKAEADLKKIEARLVQAQKMESVGRLAGGVAHDYNNMLSIIICHAELALLQAGPRDPVYDHLDQILFAAGRSADITGQLLAFARKQTIAPRALDLNQTIEPTLKMLQRLIGEGVRLEWRPGKDLDPVKMDPFQVDQILTNLCINARDALGTDAPGTDAFGKDALKQDASGTDILRKHGRIVIETENITLDEAYCAQHSGFLPGNYVMLCVSDTGAGMDRDTLENVFEPFFTTKENGKGTGLGMSTVYGVVKQNKGFITVHSEPAKGTTVRVYFPRSADAVATALPGDEACDLPLGRGETVLLAEDDPAMLALGERILAELGYTVLAAGRPEDAVRQACEFEGEIHVLVTDVIMPGMNGRQLADALRKTRPGIRVLYMSGYSNTAIARHGVLEPSVVFMAKPFSRKTIAGKIREVLEGGRG